MTLTSQSLPEGLLLTVTGRLDAVAGLAFETQLDAALGASSGAVFLDCGGLEYLSSAGIRTLLVLQRKLQAASRPLFLCGVAPTVREILRIAGLEAHLQLFAGVDEARAAAR